jgi:CheY-like chemotaxis protein
MLRALGEGGFAPDASVVDNEADFASHLNADIDVVLADFHLPRFDALKALKLVRFRDLDIPVIIVTSSRGDETATECNRTMLGKATGRGSQFYIRKGESLWN